MFVYNGLNTLRGVFIFHLLRKSRGCCMHVFSSIIDTQRTEGTWDCLKGQVPCLVAQAH